LSNGMLSLNSVNLFIALALASVAEPVHCRWSPDLGEYSMKISTLNVEAQKHFDRGLNHCFNFNQFLAQKLSERALLLIQLVECVTGA